MELAGISVPGWIHTLGCVGALVAGAWNLPAVKGTERHKRVGRVYTAALAVFIAQLRRHRRNAHG